MLTALGNGSAGQGSPWQSFCHMVGTEPAILMAIDTPDFVHHALSVILERTLRVTEMWKGTPAANSATEKSRKSIRVPAAR